MFSFTHHTTIDLFRSQLHSADAVAMYAYLAWQPYPLDSKWLMWICMYADGLDIRLRALGIFDQHGRWQTRKPSLISGPMVDIQQQLTTVSSNVSSNIGPPAIVHYHM